MTTFRARGDAILLRKYIADTYERTELEVPRLPFPVSEYDARSALLQAAARETGAIVTAEDRAYTGGTEATLAVTWKPGDVLASDSIDTTTAMEDTTSTGLTQEVNQWMNQLEFNIPCLRSV